MDLHRSRPLIRALALGCALALAAACGGGGDDDGAAATSGPEQREEATSTTEEATTTTTEAPTTTTAKKASVDDQALAEAVNLVAEDFNEQWQATSTEDEPHGSFVCLEEVDPEVEVVAEASSDSFSVESGRVQAATNGVVMVDEAAAVALLAEVMTDGFASCAAEEFSAALEGATGGEVTGINLFPMPDQSGERVSFLTGSFILDETTQGLYALELIRTGRVVTVLTVAATGDGDFPGLLEELTETIGKTHTAEVG